MTEDQTESKKETALQKHVKRLTKELAEARERLGRLEQLKRRCRQSGEPRREWSDLI